MKTKVIEHNNTQTAFSGLGCMETHTTIISTHADLHAALANLGWYEDRRASGTIFFYSRNEIIDRMIQTTTDQPEFALTMVRGRNERSVTSLTEALAWARS